MPVVTICGVGTNQQQREQARQCLGAWASFPVGRTPRPLVLLSPAVKAGSFGAAVQAKLALLQGAVEAMPGFPAEVLDALRSHHPGITPPVEPLIVTTAALGSTEFFTDRGRQQLPAWEVRARSVPEPIWVLDPNTSRQAWWPPELVGTQATWGHSTATVGPDGRTVTLRFLGNGFGEYTYAEVLEEGGAVAVLPITADTEPPGFHILPASPREVTAILARSLGPRVLLDGAGLPVMVTS